jgi:hypothetical protein
MEERMDPVASIKAFYARPRSWWERLTAEERRIATNDAAFRERLNAQVAEERAERDAALRALSPEQARALADYALSLYDSGDASQDTIPGILTTLAALQCDALAGIPAELLARDIFYPDWIYHFADAATRDELLRRVKGSTDASVNGLLQCLAWIGDDVVRAAFATWRDMPPPWHSFIFLAPDAFAHIAGWELTPEGARRDLCYPISYRFIPVESALADDVPGPVAVVSPHEGRCPWCTRLLSSLFDFDVRDPRLAFLDLPGDRMRVAFCEECSAYTTLYTDVDVAGASRLSDQNDDQPEILRLVSRTSDEDDDLIRLPQRRLALGPRRASPYEALGGYIDERSDLSQIGGYPEWIQDAHYPTCPGCQRSMRFVGQLANAEIEPYDEGMFYAFLCLDCRKATTVYQQT